MISEVLQVYLHTCYTLFEEKLFFVLSLNCLGDWMKDCHQIHQIHFIKDACLFTYIFNTIIPGTLTTFY